MLEEPFESSRKGGVKLVDAAQRVVHIDDRAWTRVGLNRAKDVFCRYVSVIVTRDDVPLDDAVPFGNGAIVPQGDSAVRRAEKWEGLVVAQVGRRDFREYLLLILVILARIFIFFLKEKFFLLQIISY